MRYMSCRNTAGAKQVCPRCRVVVTNLARHKRRNRCSAQHIRLAEKKLAKIMAQQTEESIDEGIDIREAIEKQILPE